MAYLDAGGLLDLPLPNLIGAHQVRERRHRARALRALGMDEAACTAAVTRAEWPARLQRLRRGPLVEAAGPAELWLDGGHNPAAGAALAEALTRLPPRPLHLVTGMLRTKDVEGFLRPLAALARSLHGVSIPGETATLAAEETVAAARAAGFPDARPPAGVAEAVDGDRRHRSRQPHPDLRLALPRRARAARERLARRSGDGRRSTGGGIGDGCARPRHRRRGRARLLALRLRAAARRPCANPRLDLRRGRGDEHRERCGLHRRRGGRGLRRRPVRDRARLPRDAWR